MQLRQISNDLYTQKMKMLKIHRYAFSYLSKYKAPLERHYKKNELLTGWCTPQQSAAFANRNKQVHPSHWRSPKGIDQQLKVSSLGIGTYNGQPTNEFDYEMFGAIADSILSGGINVIDTCTLYRFGKSEKVINAVLNYLVKEKGYKREEFMVSTKCGYIPNDIDSNLREDDFIKILTSDNIINQEDIVKDIHCVSPNFLDFSLEKSRLGLGLETIDILYLNNFSQAHLYLVRHIGPLQVNKLPTVDSELPLKRWYDTMVYVHSSGYGLHKLKRAFIFGCKRLSRQQKKLEDKIMDFAIQWCHLGTPQILLKWQDYTNSGIKKQVRVFDIAEAQNINIVSCSPLFQGKVANLPFQSKLLDYLVHPSAKHLQLIRSFASPVLLTTLVGMTQKEHVQQNLSLLPYPPLTEGQWKQILPIPQ